MPLHRAFENVVIVSVRRLGDIWMRQAEHIAEFGEEQGVIGAFLPALLTLPTRNEGLCSGGRIIWRWCHHL